MTLWQWLRFVLMLPKISRSATQLKDARFEEKFAALKQHCQDFFSVMKIELEVYHPEKVPTDEPVYFISNHQGTFDPVLLIAASPIPHSFISKVENLNIPVIGRWGHLIEFITFKREAFDQNVAMLRQATRFLKSGKSLLVFPEGTRSKSNDMLPFKPGALLPAYLAKVSIVPVTQIDSFRLDALGHRTRHLKVVYGDKIPYASFKDHAYEDLANMLQSEIQAQLEKYQ